MTRIVCKSSSSNNWVKPGEVIRSVEHPNDLLIAVPARPYQVDKWIFVNMATGKTYRRPVILHPVVCQKTGRTTSRVYLSDIQKTLVGTYVKVEIDSIENFHLECSVDVDEPLFAPGSWFLKADTAYRGFCILSVVWENHISLVGLNGKILNTPVQVEDETHAYTLRDLDTIFKLRATPVSYVELGIPVR
jgi:hypothetical protein